ncbi:MAG: Na/Pi cotransporter family protein [Sediminimonas qiaohouensis]|uniref:Na/Pi cotransporter family protein n=1 Tax=Sediminimonas qiaohouensis TaxID=552061 RepID=A0A7C9HC24_9RHOB|nr:Na/Pi symporter [Sediminimonas qiaohouensis]MTJ04487.1 Na/Pi cotransporter family protein [Sediminimonas qiaohouensis]
MAGDIYLVLGGIGMFLFGMKIMTEALREASGRRLRVLLARSTRTPLSGVATGAAATAAVQSSSATTVMTVGFVGAGLLSLPQSLGILYGANIGTTATGWMVTLLGFKLHLGSVAMPALFVASLVALLTTGRRARIGRVAAGLCLLFIGLDLMQDGAARFGDAVTPQSLPGAGMWAQVQLLAIGLAMTLIMQSSSAALAVVLVFLGSGAIAFAQAAAMVIGMNLGTTFTAMLATLGGSRAMRQTAVANLMFNAGTAVVAFPLLGLSAPLFAQVAAGAGAQTALVAFHTTFNVVGAMIFLPITARFGRLVQRLIPEQRPGDPAEALDPALLSDESAAMDALHTVLSKLACEAFSALGKALSPSPDMRALAAVDARVRPALERAEAYAARIQIAPDHAHARERHAALLHQADHLTRMLRRMERRAMIAVLLDDPGVARAARLFGATLARAASEGQPATQASRLAWLSGYVARRANRHRRATLLREHVGTISVADMFERTDAMRWLHRTVDHAERIANYDGTASNAAPSLAQSED